jgi:sugar lactone lactonase YvrE
VDVEFFGMQAYVLLGWGGNPADRAGLGPKSNLFGSVIRVLPNGSWKQVADVSAVEARGNPAGGPVDSNPYGLDALPGRLVVADAGANALVQACGHPNCVGSERLLALLPKTRQGREPVPTSVKQGPDGWLYAGQLTGGPFFQGASTVYRIAPDGSSVQPYVEGLTAVVDIAFDAAGTLYVLEFAKGFDVANPRLGPGLGVGRLKRKVAGQPVETVLDDLSFPGGLTVGPDGDVYVTIDAASLDAKSLTEGKVIRVHLD